MTSKNKESIVNCNSNAVKPVGTQRYSSEYKNLTTSDLKPFTDSFSFYIVNDFPAIFNTPRNVHTYKTQEIERAVVSMRQNNIDALIIITQHRDLKCYLSCRMQNYLNWMPLNINLDDHHLYGFVGTWHTISELILQISKITQDLKTYQTSPQGALPIK